MRLAFASLLMVVGCGTRASTGLEEDAIIGGKSSRALRAVGALTYDGNPECTGTLIAPRRVLTAAHCLEDADVATMGFVTGPDAFAPEKGAGVAAAVMHPGYDTDTLENDIGWVLLSQDLGVRPLGVVGPSEMARLEGTKLTFVGYGVSETDYGRKREVVMTLDELLPGEIWYGNDEKNVCDGDSGGPALHETSSGDRLVAGVTSAGDEDCAEYGISTRVDPYLSFLEIAAGAPGKRNDACKGETFFGRCDGPTLVYCDGGNVTKVSCERACGLAGPEGFDCLDTSDACAGETAFGRCEGARLVWCDGSRVRTRTCTRCGLAGPGGYDCL